MDAHWRLLALCLAGHWDERDGALVKAANAAVVLLLDHDQFLPAVAERKHQPPARRPLIDQGLRNVGRPRPPR